MTIRKAIAATGTRAVATSDRLVMPPGSMSSVATATPMPTVMTPPTSAPRRPHPTTMASRKPARA